MSIFTHFFPRVPYLSVLSSLVAAVVFWHILLAYSIPFWISCGLASGAGAVFLFMKRENVLLFVSALLGVSAALMAILHVSGLENAIYYDPASVVGIEDSDLGHGRFKANQDFEMTMPYGNLVAISFSEDVPGEQRSIHFKTDSFGFRNSRNYSGQRYVLVGDSFIVGNGNSQEDILSERLINTKQLDVFNIAFPGYIRDYDAYIKTFERYIKHDANETRYFLFLFEGNDFPEPRPDDDERRRTVSYEQRYQNHFKELNIYRVSSSLQSRIKSKKEVTDRPPVSTFIVGGKKISFLNRYMEVSWRPSYSGGEEFDNVLAENALKIEHIFFIPTKYRVYHEFLNSSQVGDAYKKFLEKDLPSDTLPNSQWEFIFKKAQQYNIAITNFTPALQDKARALISSGEFVYWPDDTHWNKQGIEAASGVVAEVIRNAETKTSSMYSPSTL